MVVYLFFKQKAADCIFFIVCFARGQSFLHFCMGGRLKGAKDEVSLGFFFFL